MRQLPDFAELRCLSNFSFLKGASWPDELVARAHKLGYSAIAITDECSMAGVVRAHVAAKAHGIQLLVGSQFDVQAEAPFQLVVLACNLNGYGNLCEWISRQRRQARKGSYRLSLDEIGRSDLSDCVVVACPERHAKVPAMLALARWLFTHFLGRAWLGIDLLRRSDDEIRLLRLREVSAQSGIPLVATGNATMHVPSRKPLLDVMTATRLGKPLTECGRALDVNAERHLRTRGRLARTFPQDLLAQSLQVAARCQFSLDELKYRYPSEVVPAGETPSSHLRRITYEGAQRRWPGGVSPAMVDLIERELRLIAELGYEHYFLTVADIVQFARSRHILCQGRGSAANSVVCYCTGVTEVDPARMNVLFERFISKERNEPPDIDIDFEHERREEVIQHLYSKYSRERAALTAVVISYRVKSALKDVGKALGFPLDTLSRLSDNHQWWDGTAIDEQRLVEIGMDVHSLAVQQLLALTRQLLGMPRHLSQHPGGFVLTQGALTRLVPVENASMPERTVIQWDKDDLDAVGLLKVDVLGLGMLTAIRKTLDFVSRSQGRDFRMQDIPAEDPATYDMIGQGDTVGVFQIESRAQRSMLPRLKPRCFYDLVIEVAIVRPGPIQGQMVHPYLRRRQGHEAVSYPQPELATALGRTLGVPLFQEQVMQVAMVAAGYSGGEADALRRDMAAWKRKGGLQKHHAKIVDGMTARGYEPAFAEAIFKQIQGFSEYGFPESHAASFALLVYASCWLKRHHPAAFLAGLLNSQPLGFYSPSQLVQDAQRHGVPVLPVDVAVSDWDCQLEAQGPTLAVRLGLRHIKGLPQEAADTIAKARASAPFSSAEDLARRAGLNQHQMTTLAGADALRSLSGHRRQQVWEAAAQRSPPALLRAAPIEEPPLALPPAPEGEEVFFDYATTGLTLRRHPLALLRPQLSAQRLLPAIQLRGLPNRRAVRTCGIVTTRQQPETAKGTVFISLEDETGDTQVIVHKAVWLRQRQVMVHARLLEVRGSWQVADGVAHLIAGHLVDLTPMLGGLTTRGREFR